MTVLSKRMIYDKRAYTSLLDETMVDGVVNDGICIEPFISYFALQFPYRLYTGREITFSLKENVDKKYGWKKKSCHDK